MIDIIFARLQACIGFIIKLFSPSPSRLLTDLAWCCGENEGGMVGMVEMVGMVGSGTTAATPAAATNAAATCRMPIAKTEGHSQPERPTGIPGWDHGTEQNRTGQGHFPHGSSGSSRVCSRLTRFSAPMPPRLCSL
jgi:hypothetical protein